MDEKLYEILKELPKENLINLMWEALDYMQGSNTRTRTQCIILSIGGEVSETNTGNLKYKLPHQTDMLKNTETMGL